MKKRQRSTLGPQLHGKQLLALLLSVLLLLASLPVAAIAEDGLPQEEGGAPQIYDNTAEGANAAEADEGEVMEIESLREASVKHFYMGDGTYRAVSYGSAVHRKDAEGAWQEIDNTLTLQNGYHTTPDGRIKLASGSTANGYLLQLAENGYGIDMAMLPPSEPSGDMSMDMNANATLHTGSVTIQNAQREAVLESDSAEVQYQKLSKTLNHSKLTYANLSAGLDVSYELSGNKITERIVVKGARESYEFAFRLSLTGLTAALDEENTITFADAATGAAVYRMSLPYVNLGERGAQLAAAYALEQVEEGDYLLLISADGVVEELLASVEAEAENSTMATINVNYVTVTTAIVQIPREFETGEYAYISESSPTTSYTDVEMISVGGGDIGYIYVPLPSNLEFASINSAYLSLYCEVEERFDLRIHRCTAQWHTLGNFVYNYALNAWTNFGLDSNNYLDFAIGTKETVSFDVTELVSDWQFGDAPNYGFGLAGVEEELSMWFYRDGDDAEPVLTVTYQYVDVSISDGIYYLQNAMYESFMQVANNTVYVSDFVASSAQKWKFTSIDNGFYKISPVNNANLVLTASSNTIGNSVTVQAVTNGTLTAYQQWQILAHGSYIVLCPRSSYMITGSPAYERCIGAAPNPDSSGRRNVNVYSNLGVHSSDEGWNLINVATALTGKSVDTGVYYVVSAKQGADKVIARVELQNTSGYPISGERATGTYLDQWKFTYLYNGYYKITSVYNNLALTVQSGSEDSGTDALIQSTYAGNDRQQWKIILLPSGNYKIAPKSGEEYTTDFCMALGDPLSQNNDSYNIKQSGYTPNNENSDEWTLYRKPDNIRMEKQDGDSTCWAASAIMTATNYMEPQLTELEIALHVKTGFSEDSVVADDIGGGTVSEAKEAIEFLLHGIIEFRAMSYVRYGEETLRHILDQNCAVYIGRGIYSTFQIRTTGHAVVIVGYNWDEDIQQYVYTIYDPNGFIHVKTYAQLCCEPYQTNTNLHWVWDHIVISKADGYLNVIAPSYP